MTKTWIKRGLVATHALELAGRLRDRQVVILLYHSIMDPAAGANTLGQIMHRPEVFRGHMETIARSYHPVSMDDVLRFLNGKQNLPPRSIAVTFDDGYLDNYEVAAPILERIGVPGAFYVAVSSIETGKLPWPGRLRYAFFTTRCVQWSDHLGMVHPLNNNSQRERAFLEASDYCATLCGTVQENFVQSVESELEMDPQTHPGMMMNWDHLRSLVQRGHIVGSHTMTHPNVAYISDEQARIELGDSRRKLEQILGFPVLHFSYPGPALSPNWKDSTTRICREVGYQTAVTTDGGSVGKHHNPLQLRRSGPTKRIEGLPWSVDCSFLGRRPSVLAHVG